MDMPDGQEGLIVDLFRHNKWANLKMLDACRDLGDEHLDANIPGTFGSIRDTLLHIVGAEVSYVHRVTGRLPGEPPAPGTVPSIEHLRHDAGWSGEELLRMALNATPADRVQQNRRGLNVSYKLTALLTQSINHATEHRAQIATILTQQGIEPPDMSGWAYMSETGQLEETPEAEASVQ